MLWVFVSARHRSQIGHLRRWRGGEFRRRVRTISYESLRHRPGLPGGAYLFTNLEVLDPRLFERAGMVASAIREHSPNSPILNDPRSVKRRFELIRTLHREGINSFTAYRADEGRVPSRWPVFLRGEQDHYGGEPALLPDAAALADALAAARDAGRDLSRRLIVEFVDTRGSDDLYRKYAAFRIGSAIYPRHVFFGKQWMVKMPAKDPTPEQVEEEALYAAGCPHRDQIMRAFDLAGLQFGRIDYGVRGDGIEVWEINSNPTIVARRVKPGDSRWEYTQIQIGQVADALMEVARTGAGMPRIPSRALLPIRPRNWRRLAGG